MKTIKKLSFLFLVTLSITSCGKLDITPDDNDDSGSSSGSKVSGSMKGTLDGKAWEAKSVSFGGLFATIDMVGKIDDNNFISLQFTDTKLELGKTYQFDNKNLEANLLGVIVGTIDGKNMLSKSGTFKFTKYKKNSVIEGEMNVILTNFLDPDKEFKNCTFSMKY
ncbi:hypothetical protein [Lacihabitans soyangensis]|uniref:Uncharacterized protein n=1 Tax=Lacihabitans soyangensis TaxID=869394 RepID=A0AAE3H7P3_9BACT|nr:hypothetical protein [Lacihabitans soyangensis]MCP9766017.1 hypothetical protein [Lacihabitans soyangensis]